jgi:glycosyltransferase involved in cell wall biosynthesis
MLNDITPVILTFDEAPNIGRSLAQLTWARRIIVVDSGSRDDTLAICATFPNVQVVTRTFTSHADQWNHAVAATGIDGGWILALDADYVLSDALIEELRGLAPPLDVAGFSASFTYCVDGRALRGTLYPPVTVLFRHGAGRYVQDGHTQRLVIGGRIVRLRHPIRHDDRKPLARWVASQDRYAHLESEKLAAGQGIAAGWPDRIRRLYLIAPAATLFYCLFGKGLILDGWPGIYYSLQRTFAELLLSLYLVRRRLHPVRATERPP